MCPPPHKTMRPGEGPAPIQGQREYLVHLSNTLGMWHLLLLSQEWGVYDHKLSAWVPLTYQSRSPAAVGNKEYQISCLHPGNIY